MALFFFSSRRRHTRCSRDWSSDVCSSDLLNVTETYAPFLEFGGPPVKVRALAEGLARSGHPVTVLTADWGLEKHAVATAERSEERRVGKEGRSRGSPYH